MNDRERSLDITYRADLAVVWAILLLRSNLEGTQLTVRARHHALTWTLFLADVTGKLSRFRPSFMEYALNIVHPTGVTHQAAEALLPLHIEETDDYNIGDDILIVAVAMYEQKKLNNVNNNTPETDSR